MLDMGGKPLLAYKLEALPDEVDEVVIVVGYLGSVIQKHFGGSYIGKRILYIEQGNLNGTAGALWTAKDILKGRFLIMAGDDIYDAADIAECAKQSDSWKMLVQQLPEMHRAGSVQIGSDGNIDRIIESSEEGEERVEPGLASTSLFTVDDRLFGCPMVPKFPGSMEYGHPQTIVAAARTLGVPLEPVYTDKWIQITSPKDLVYAAKILTQNAG
jgi:NDP-sugar pyrophosphorylase family protein